MEKYRSSCKKKGGPQAAFIVLETSGYFGFCV